MSTDAIRVDMVDPQSVALREIADKRMTRDDVALTYAFMMRPCRARQGRRDQPGDHGPLVTLGAEVHQEEGLADARSGAGSMSQSEQSDIENRRSALWPVRTDGNVIRSAEWAMKADRKLDELDDEQLIYLHSAIEVTLDERGYRFDERKAGTRRWGRPGA